MRRKIANNDILGLMQRIVMISQQRAKIKGVRIRRNHYITKTIFLHLQSGAQQPHYSTQWRFMEHITESETIVKLKLIARGVIMIVIAGVRVITVIKWRERE